MEKSDIIKGIKDIDLGDLSGTVSNLFDILGYDTSRRAPLDEPTPQSFVALLRERDLDLNKERARFDDWNYADILFQITDEEVSKSSSLFASKGADKSLMESYLFILIGLKGENYTRTILSEITREINRLFPMPVMVVFHYGTLFTLAIIDRRFNKKDSDKNVLSKVTLIKDISTVSPHRAHVEILHDLSPGELQRKYQFTDFLGLHKAWKETLDIKTLSKKFFNELADWFFWAHDKVSFPNDRNIEHNNNVQMNLIRLITRLIFVWFLKEKNLVPDKLFDKRNVSDILQSFNPDSRKESNYYNAILQNLFFATLNQKMGARKFAVDGVFSENKKEYGVKNLFRYSYLFKVSKDEVLKHFENIPFLNGGLFDCLDKPDDSGKVIYVDGFTRRQDKVASIPEILFWGSEEKVDLTEFYESDKKRIRDCKGLLQIFSSYKFTIEENTPVEEEIALDPELLGKVFENLLAFYNPETATTARKSTGSYYTPREIVNYMVDESLISYLKDKLLQGSKGVKSLGNLLSEAGSTDLEIPQESSWINREDELDATLRDLVGFNANPHLFSEADVQILIYAIDHIKVLDPSCGSGAFPMGVLHKLVYLLGKLDPDNRRWRELQKLKALSETSKVFDLSEQEVRDQRLKELSEAFENNSSDYGRKLYLIENCIYGVDIQPIAVQISKLRFFISLLVDQKEQPDAENRGLRALPNLETKFVAANTLFGLTNSDTPNFKAGNIDDLEAELKSLRARHFEVKTYTEKMHLQAKDKELRRRIAESLEAHGFPSDSAKKIGTHNIYDQISSSEWFDPEWMFGIGDGFDIVIGNPPYIRADDPLISETRKAILLSKSYKTLWEKWDIYVAFMERGFNLTKQKGKLTFIIPDAYTIAKYAIKSQDFFIKHSKVERIDFCAEVKIFEAGVRNIIFLFTNITASNSHPTRIRRINDFENYHVLESGKQSILGHKCFVLDLDHESKTGDTQAYVDWGRILYVSKGMVLHGHETLAHKEFVKSDLVSNSQTELHTRRYLEAKWIKAFQIQKIKFLEWESDRVPSKVSRPTFAQLYNRPKIMTGAMTGSICDDTGILCNHSCIVSVRWCDLKGTENNSIKGSIKKDFRSDNQTKNYSAFREELEISSEQFILHYLLAVVNSSYARNFLKGVRRSKLGLYPDDIKQLPIRLLSLDQQTLIGELAKYVELCAPQNTMMFNFFYNLLDCVIFEVYYPQKFEQNNISFFDPLSELLEKDQFEFEMVTKLYGLVSQDSHEIYKMMNRVRDFGL